MDIIFSIALKSMARSVHHKVAIEAIDYIPENWKRLFLKYVQDYLKGSKAPDKQFHDFINHVYHVHQEWGGAPKSVELWYNNFVNYLKMKKWKDAIFAAGVMTHYYTDVSHPFHTAQTEEEARIHSYTEFGGAEIFQKEIHPHLVIRFKENKISNIQEYTISLAKKSFDYYTDFFEKFDTSKASNYKWGKAYSPDLIKTTTMLLSEAISGCAKLIVQGIYESKIEVPKTRLVLKTFIESLKIPIYWILRKMDKSEKKKITKKIEKEMKETGKVFHSLSTDDRTVVSEYKEAKEKNLEWIDHPKLEEKKTIGLKTEKKEKKEVKLKKEEKEILSSRKEAKQNEVEPQPIEPKEKVAKSEVKKAKAKKYYLKLDDPIVDAPEIGKKTAEKLMNLGINTVADLLKVNSTEIAQKLGSRYIKADDIERWKVEAKLQTEIAGTRGHDVRIMYTLGIKNVDELTKYKPEELLKKATEAAKELGPRVVSNSSMPSFEEVSMWITNAK